MMILAELIRPDPDRVPDEPEIWESKIVPVRLWRRQFNSILLRRWLDQEFPGWTIANLYSPGPPSEEEWQVKGIYGMQIGQQVLWIYKKNQCVLGKIKRFPIRHSPGFLPYTNYVEIQAIGEKFWCLPNELLLVNKIENPFREL